MRTLSLLLLSGALMTACVDRDYDLSDLDFDNVAIGDENSEFRIPLATVQVSMDEIAENGVNIEAIFREADIWLPSSEKEVNLPALTGDSDYRDGLIGNTIAEMRLNPEKLDGVVRLTYEKYYDEFAEAIGIEESGIPLEEYTEAFKTALELSADEIETRIKQVASDYLKTIDIEPVEYEIGHIDLDDEVIDMLSDNLDPEGTPDAKNTLHIYGSISSRLPVTMRLEPVFLPPFPQRSSTPTTCGRSWTEPRSAFPSRSKSITETAASTTPRNSKSPLTCGS